MSRRLGFRRVSKNGSNARDSSSPSQNAFPYADADVWFDYRAVVRGAVISSFPFLGVSQELS